MQRDTRLLEGGARKRTAKKVGATIGSSGSLANIQRGLCTWTMLVSMRLSWHVRAWLHPNESGVLYPALRTLPAAYLLVVAPYTGLWPLERLILNIHIYCHGDRHV